MTMSEPSLALDCSKEAAWYFHCWSGSASRADRLVILVSELACLSSVKSSRGQ
jgi:hypothetical protein